MYVKDEGSTIYRREGFSGISYCDGAAIEGRIFDIVKSARDRGTFSVELAHSIVDWPTEYHLSQQRHCLIRPLGIKPGDRVLELGCGCGAITRFLGELGAEVVGVEGSVMRARIAAERCRDLPNVRVIAEDLLQFESDQQFDWILLIGVLEYAPVFSTGGDPALDYLIQVSRFLEPDGRLVVAIENKLGIKYFNGCGEDHIGIPFHGVQGLYTANQPRTFGRRELTNIIKSAGLDYIDFLFPFPDYKLPRVILAEAALTDIDFHPAELLATVYARDYGGVDNRLFNEPLVIREAARNGLLGELSNSFLVLASKQHSENSLQKMIGVTYAVQRRREFATQTKFVRDGESIKVVKKCLSHNSSNEYYINESELLHKPLSSEYNVGKIALWRLIETRARGGSVEKITEALVPWFEFLISGAFADAGVRKVKNIADLYIDSRFLDATPYNLVEMDGGRQFIDLEWELDSGKIPVGWVVTRSVLHSLGNPGFDLCEVAVMDVINGLCSRYHLDVCDTQIAEWLRYENQLLFAVTGRNCNIPLAPVASRLAPLHRLAAEQDAQLTALTRKMTMIQRSLLGRIAIAALRVKTRIKRFLKSAAHSENSVR